MKLAKKLVFYFFGVGLGLLMVFFIFGDRDIQCNYFPNDRVLYDLAKKEVEWTPQAEEHLGDFLADDILQGALERGKVDFSASNARQSPCGLYWLEWDQPPKRIQVANCDSVLRVLRLDLP
jgi:hypothetical protein